MGSRLIFCVAPTALETTFVIIRSLSIIVHTMNTMPNRAGLPWSAPNHGSKTAANLAR